MITASGSRTVPEDQKLVWRALAVLRPYCAVCDVSYVVTGDGPARRGTTFACVPGRVDGGPAPDTAPRGEIVEWHPPRQVTTRLTLGPETWTTRIRLEKADDGATRVELSIEHEPAPAPGLVQRLQRRSIRRLVERMVADELAKLPDHIAAVDT